MSDYEKHGDDGHKVEQGTVYATVLANDWRLIVRHEYDGSDHAQRGGQVRGYFSDYCKANLADEDYDIPSARHDTSSKAWFAELKQHGGRISAERYWDPGSEELEQKRALELEQRQALVACRVNSVTFG